jgi:hypothetical protein
MMPDTGRSGALDWKGHLLLLHSAESERVSALVTWIRRGLDNNEKVIFTETRGEPAERSAAGTLFLPDLAG